MKLYKQNTDYTCGPACIRMAISYYSSVCPTEEAIATLASTTEDIGTLPKDMVKVVRALGYKPVVKIDCDLIELCTLSTRVPCIVLYEDEKDSYHYSLVMHVDEDSITLADPYIGKEKVVSLEYFLSHWHYSDGTKGWMLTI